MDKLRHQSFSRTSAVTAVLGISVFILLALAVVSGETTAIDRIVADAVRLGESLLLSSLMRGITHTASVIGATVIGLVLCGIEWGVAKRRRRSITLASLIAASLTIGTLLKLLFARPRPEWYPWLIRAHGFSFPSGHTLASLVISGGILWVAWKPGRYLRNAGIGLCLGFWTGCIGFSRVYLGVHYASDVAGSLALGTFFLSISYIYLHWSKKWKH